MTASEVEIITELQRQIDDDGHLIATLRGRIAAIKATALQAQEILGKTRDHESPAYVCEAHNLLDDIREM